MNGISIFIDESGDLGSNFENKRTKQFFVIGALTCNNAEAYKGVQKAIERTLKSKFNKKSKTGKKIGELKGYKTNFNVKKYFFNKCNNIKNWYLYFYVLDKIYIDNLLGSKEGKSRVYNLLAKELMDKINFNQHDQLVNLYLDKHKSRKEERIFNQYIETHLATKISLNSRLNCYHLDSRASRGVQAIDMFLWGVYEKYNYQETKWYDLFKEKILFEGIFMK